MTGKTTTRRRTPSGGSPAGGKAAGSAALPFGFDKSSRIGLAKQIADGFARAIRDGVYRRGEVLPSIKELSSSLGVSEITVRGSLRRLVDIGVVSPRRGIGSVVTGDAGPLKRGRVLIVTTAFADNFCNATMIAVLREELLRAGYLPNQVSVVLGADGRPDYTQLDQLLVEGNVLAVVFGTVHGVWRRIERTGLKCIVVGDAGTVHVEPKLFSAVPDFVSRCRMLGAEDVVVPVVSIAGYGESLAEEFARSGFKVRLWKIRRVPGVTAREVVYRATYGAFVSRYGEKGAPLPDVFFVPDDYSAMAALSALDDCGVDVPGDVGFVAWSARGSFPFYRKSVTRLETDPAADGRKFARLVLDHLSGKAIPPDSIVGSTFIVGETF